MLTKDVSNKLQNNDALEYGEMRNILNTIIKEARELNNIEDPYDTDCMKCEEMNLTLQKLSHQIGITYFPVTAKELNIPDLTHYFGIFVLPGENGIRCFLADGTYSQFFKDMYTFDSLEQYAPVGNYMKTTEQNDFAKQLRYFGYVDFTEENFKMYLNGFLDAYCNGTKETIDRESFFQNVENFLDDAYTPIRYTEANIIKQDNGYFKSEEGSQTTLQELIQEKQKSMFNETKEQVQKISYAQDILENVK